MCLDIVGTESPENETNPANMSIPSQIVHPDAKNQNRYVTGTRLQTHGKKKSHKLKSCQFHNLDNSRQGTHIKTMSQGEVYCFVFDLHGFMVLPFQSLFRMFANTELFNLISCVATNVPT